MLKLFSFLRPYRLAAAAALLLMLTELVVELWHPLLMAKIINEGIIANNMDNVLLWGGVMVGLSLFGFAGGIINSYLAAHVSQGFGYQVRKQLFERVQSFSFNSFNRFSTPTLITRITSDVTQLQNLVFMGLRILLRAPLIMIGGLTMALLVDFKLALVLIVVTPIVFGILIWVMNRSFRMFRAVQEKLDIANGVLRENLVGMRLIRAFVRRDHENDRFATANKSLTEQTVSVLRLVELSLPILLLVMNLSILFILWYGNMGQGTGSNVGNAVAVVNYALRITGAFSVISFIVTGISRAKASGNRVVEVMNTETDIVDSTDVNQSLRINRGKLSFNNVSFSYPGMAQPALQSVSFTIKPGQTVAVLGATGSGKSTLFQLIPRLYDVDEGDILIDDTDIRQFALNSLRRDIGYVPQESLLFTGTVRDNIQWGQPEATQEEVIDAARAAQIHDTIMKLPQGYDTVLGQKGVNLSGGQKQRLSIARALIRRPGLLLLDDSTSALDAGTEARLLDALRGYSCTTIIIAQKIDTARAADTILLLEDGRLLAQGHHDELLRNSPLYRRIISSQDREGDAV
ncbi:ABC transporter ATP-binding protein [Paenibacillaceae bacterium]|nr:ABC transporter ATP-binding protein [Paenibacillaceae bacterium]